MFELRWIASGPDGKLQFRKWKIRIDASGAVTPLPIPIEWTDWADVPVVPADQIEQQSTGETQCLHQ